MRSREGTLRWVGVLVAAACGSGSSASSDAGRDGADARADAGADGRRPADSGAPDAIADAPREARPETGPPDGGSCPHVGSGKTTYACPAGGTDVMGGDDLEAAVRAAPANATLCIHGPHRITSPLVPKKGHTWIGVDATAAIDGSAVLDAWSPAPGLPGVWVYAGPLAALAGQPNQNGVMSGSGASTVYACYRVSTYEDDVFYGGARVMRVLSTAELTGPALPAGQALTSAETGRFFFDYAARKIYLTLDPSAATVELATVATLVDGHGVEGVTLENLLIQKALGNGVVAGPSAKLADLTVRYAHETGVEVGSGTQVAPTTLDRVLTTNHGRYGLAGAGSWVFVSDTEISWNNIANHVRVTPGSSGACDYMTGSPGGYWGAGGAKIVLAAGGSPTDPDLRIDGVESHDNVGPGFWTDVNDEYVRVSGGRYYRNEWVGYFHEIGCDIEITGVESDHNGTPIKNTGTPGYGIQISDSNNADVHDNVIHDNASGAIGLIWQLSHSGISGMKCVSPPPTSDTDTSHVFENNRFARNRIYSCATGATTGMEYGKGELLTSRGNVFAGNTYHVPDTTGAWWADPGAVTFSAWQGFGLDTTGSQAAPCTYSAPPTCGK